MSQLSSLQGVGTLPLLTVNRTRLCEVPSLVSWMYCFAAYVAIRTPNQLTRKMLAYAQLIIREALKHGGPGWAEYDKVFRRQLSINPLLSWNTLGLSLQAATILGQRNTGGTLCSLCQECDHTSSQCALASPTTAASSALSISCSGSPPSPPKMCGDVATYLCSMEQRELFQATVLLQTRLHHMPEGPQGTGL